MKRKAILLSVMVGALLVAVAGVAWAATIQCDGVGDTDPDPGQCAGTSNGDVITGTTRADIIKARGSGAEVDQVMARRGEDTITGDGDQPGLQPDGDGLCFACLGTFGTTGLTINLATGTATDGTNTVTWDTTSGPFIENATGGTGADHITGSSRFNIIDALSGNDTINTADGDGADIINCGDGPDTVIKDTGDTANQCEL